MKKKISLFVFVIAIIFTVLITSLVGTILFYFSKIEDNSPGEKISEISDLVDRYYLYDYDRIKAGDAAAEAYLSQLGDKWSYYISAEDYPAYLENFENSFVGIGVMINMTPEENGYIITEVTENSPAMDSGLQIGDIILSVDGEAALNMQYEEFVQKVRGEEGTSVKIGYFRNGKEYAAEIIRSRVENTVAYSAISDDGIGYLRICNFEEHSAQQTIACIQEFVSENAKGIIFDVRSNPGGLKSELVEILDYLLPAGDIFHSVDYNGKENTDISDENCVECPMVVLTNKDTYSAAEFFAAALQEYNWATVVGEPTCGKANFQVVFPLTDGSAVAFSVGEYTTPKGISLKDVGVKPDVEVENTTQNDTDIQLETARKMLQNQY